MKAIGMLVLSLLVAFGAASEVDAQQTLTKVRVGVLPIYDTLPMYVGRDEGFFKEVGIDLELIPSPGGPAAIAAMEGGSLDITYTGVTSILDVTAQGLAVKVIAPAGTVSNSASKDGARYIARNDDTIKVLSDLKGKRIAVNQLRNVVHLYVVAALDAKGLPPNSYTVLELPYPQMPDGLLNNQVDMIYEVEPFTIALLETGKARDFGNLTFDVHPQLRIAAYISTQRWLDKNADIAKRVRQAYAKSADYVMKNVSQHGEWQTKYFRLKPEYQGKITTAIFQDGDLGADFIASLNKTKSLMLKYGFLKKDLDVQNLIFR